MIQLRKMTPKSGFVHHLVPYPSDGTALCGYRPSSPKGRLIRNRAGWRHPDDHSPGPCEKCAKRFDQEKHEVMN